MICKNCGILFRHKNGHKKTCSPACEHEWRVKSLNKRWSGKTCKNVCVVCGKKFLRYGNKKTCSPTCSKIRRQQTTKVGEKMAAERDSIHAQKGTQEYKVCKKWCLRSPDGTIYRFKNMSYFVKRYKHLFSPEDLVKKQEYPRAFYMLGKLRPSRKQSAKSWHGWTWGD